ncbi:MAG: hypothetical protein JWO37_1107 [Acidimicrobiales bacterium]|jgi:murein DD-endopeptidase MepM/ murein hydrolase activator NlpD|nr:hypothetical protein [Acidimicrobiales bacterium]
MSLTRPWRALVRLAAVPTAVLGLASLHSGATLHPGTAPVQEAVVGRALAVDRLRASAEAAMADKTVDAASVPAVFVTGANPSPEPDRVAVAAYLAAASRSRPITFGTPWVTLAWPLRGPITGPYGERRGNGRHPGIDISVSPGTPVHAAAPGRIVGAGVIGGYEGYGIVVVIDHGNGMITIYAHLSKVGASIGQVVGTGDVIGASGCSGACTGPHLHFEVRVDGSTRNPMDYLPA